MVLTLPNISINMELLISKFQPSRQKSSMFNYRRKYSYVQRNIYKRQQQYNIKERHEDDTIENFDSQLDFSQHLSTKTEPRNETRWKMKASYNPSTGSLQNYKLKYRAKWVQFDNKNKSTYRTNYVEKKVEPQGKKWNFKKFIPRKVYKEDIMEDSSSRESYDTLSTSAKSEELKKIEVQAKQCVEAQKQTQQPKPHQNPTPNKQPQQPPHRSLYTDTPNNCPWAFINNQLDWLFYFRRQNKCYCTSCGYPANFQYQFCINCFMSYCYYWVVNHQLFVVPDHVKEEPFQEEIHEDEQVQAAFEHCLLQSERFIASLLD